MQPIIKIPGFGAVRAEHLVSDFTGTLSVDGKLLAGVEDQLNLLARVLRIHIVTSDTFGAVRSEMKGVSCSLHLLAGVGHDLQKEDYVNKLGAERVIAIGNGNNDRRMLKAARIGIAVSGGEGCAVDALLGADIVVGSVAEGLSLLLHPARLKATLRF
ncbi:MAG: HAD hydrolase family protein [Deltaproteobacteria bacterium]|nr:HAD hydrolase family protein [Deltaproteobacteria bacterium]